MIVLTETTDVLRFVAEAGPSAALPCVVTYRAITNTTYVPQRFVEDLSPGATTNILPAVPASTRFLVDTILIRNTGNAVFSGRVEIFEGTKAYTLWRGSIPAKGALRFKSGRGFSRENAAGDIDKKTLILPGQTKWIAIVNKGPEVSVTPTWVAGVTGAQSLPETLLLNSDKGLYAYVSLFGNCQTDSTANAAGHFLSYGLLTIGNSYGPYNATAGVKRTAVSGTSSHIRFTSTTSSLLGTTTVATDATGGCPTQGEVVSAVGGALALSLSLSTEAGVSSMTATTKPGTIFFAVARIDPV